MRLPFTPPFVVTSVPEDVKAIYTAPPDVLHPGEGARVLQPLVGKHSVILLDGDPHMEQRKLLLPAFHGERMERLADLVADVTEREIAGWDGEAELELHPRMQALTLEIILRAVFGLDPGRRLDAPARGPRDRALVRRQPGEPGSCASQRAALRGGAADAAVPLVHDASRTRPMR